MTPRWAWTALLVVLVGSTAACGDDTATMTSAGGPTSHEPTPETTATHTAAPAAEDLGPSVLDLLEGRGQHGTFSITISSSPPDGSDHTYTGRYVRTTSGGTYTVADLDLPLVLTEVQRLLAMQERFDSLEPSFADAFLSPDTAVTDQLQLGLADVLMRSGLLGEAGALAMAPWLAFTAVEANPLEPCQDALAALRSAVEDRVEDDAAQLGQGWEPDADRLGAAENEVANQACDGLSGLDTSGVGLAVDDVRLSATFDGEPFLTLVVRPGDGEPVTVTTPRSAPMLDDFGLFFLAIDRCGELPWMYSNFAAANSYTSPDDGSYIGPGPFSEPVCAEEVPR